MKQHIDSSSSPDTMSEKLVFLVGPPRSGTTWLQGILANHPNIGTAQESHLFNHFLQPMMSKWNEMVAFDDGRGGIGLPTYLTEEEFICMTRDTAHRVYSSVPEYHSNPLFLDKTPDHIRCIADIRRVFPNAKFVVLLRKPEDVIESLLNASKSWGKNWAPSSIFSAVRTFQYFFSVPGTDDLILNDSSLCVVRYEALKESPAATLNTVLSYLDQSVDSATMANMIKKPHELRKYGESAISSGTSVEEPKNFARKKKGKLSWLQKIIVRIALAKHSKLYGYSQPSISTVEHERVSSAT